MMPHHDKGQRPGAPPLQGRGLGWGLSVERLGQLHGYAAEMRRSLTEPEKRLWRHLSNSQLGGYKFRRQSVIGPYVADFFCPRKGLVGEADGDTHGNPTIDQVRDAALDAMGFRVLHVTNADIMRNMEGALTQILATLVSMPDRRNSPHPTPSPEGEGLQG